MEDIQTISISEFKATCLKLIEQVRRTGKQLLITKNGEPAALISPPPAEMAVGKAYCGIAKSKLKIVGDIVSPIEITWDALSK